MPDSHAVTVRGPSEVARQEPSLLEIIRELAVDARVDVAKLEGLMQLQERAEARSAKQEYVQAFARLQLALPRVKKNGSTISFHVHPLPDMCKIMFSKSFRPRINSGTCFFLLFFACIGSLQREI